MTQAEVQIMKKLAELKDASYWEGYCRRQAEQSPYTSDKQNWNKWSTASAERYEELLELLTVSATT